MRHVIVALCLALAVSAGAAVAERPPLVLDEPTGIAVAPGGRLLVVESGRHRLVRIDAATGRERHVTSFSRPWGVAVSAAGVSFVGDGSALVRVDSHGTKSVLATVPGRQVGAIAIAPGGDVFFTTAAAIYRLQGGRAGTPEQVTKGTKLSLPHGLAVRPDGKLLVSDTNAGRLLVVDPTSGKASTFARIGHPRGVAVAADGTVFVVAADAGRVLRLDPTGRRRRAVGPGFTDPYALTRAADGTVYALDVGPAGLIRRIAPGGASSVVAR